MATKKGKVKVGDEEQLEREVQMRGETAIMRLQVACNRTEAAEARRAEQEWRDKCAGYHAALAALQEDTHAVTNDMMRNYKGLQTQMQASIRELEAQVAALQIQLQEQTSRAERAEAQCADVTQRSAAEVKVLQDKITSLQHEFADMLRGTIAAMHQKLKLAYAQGSSAGLRQSA